MMSKIFLSILITIFGFLTGVQKLTAQEKLPGKNDFSEMTLTVEFNKKAYLPLEPICAKFTFSNQTKLSLNSSVPNFAPQSKIQVTDGNVTNIYDSITLLGGRPNPFKKAFFPGESLEESILLETNLEKFFPHSGVFRVRFLLFDGNELNLTSNMIVFEIQTPTGIDAKALSFLKKNKDKNQFPSLVFSFLDNDKIKSGQNLLATFVDRFSESGYREYATYLIGISYFHCREFEKAKIEFTKLKSSENAVFARESEHYLSEIRQQTN